MMKHTYSISGMTCESCAEKIAKTLSEVEHITGVIVDRDDNTAEITMSEHVQTSVMQEALNKIGSYTISMDMGASIQSIKKNHIKDLIPLFAIVGGILLFSIMITLVTNNGFTFGMRMFMAGFFVVFGLLKLLKLKDFAIAYKEYDIIAMRSDVYAHTYPFIELGLGFLYLSNLVPMITNTITIVVMGVGAIGVYLKLRKKEEIPCACLGTVFKVPMTWVTLVEDLLMVVMAIIMIIVSIN